MLSVVLLKTLRLEVLLLLYLFVKVMGDLEENVFKRNIPGKWSTHEDNLGDQVENNEEDSNKEENVAPKR